MCLICRLQFTNQEFNEFDAQQLDMIIGLRDWSGMYRFPFIVS